MPRPTDWPDLATPGWTDTEATLHLWTQIVGKTRLALAPMQNHWWQVPLYVTARGLGTSLIENGGRAFEVELDLVAHELRVRDAAGRTPSFPLESISVAEFYRRYREVMRAIDVEVAIMARPVEVPEAIPFAADEQHRTYDRDWVERLFTVLVHSDAILKAFRGEFLGKASPVHFFWGGFDLAVTRFSGRPAPKHGGGIPNCPDWVMHEAYSHEVSSAGFWPGAAWFPEAVFYAYAYPAPDGFASAPVRPAAARYEPALGEFVLPYAAVRTSKDPVGDVRAFLESTYVAAADLAHWDRRALERVTAS
jgi:hypothetical protein